jgi:hypothetical protein
MGGFLAMTGLLQLTQIALSKLAMLNIEVIISNKTICLGFSMGILIPFISNVIPVRQALGQTLKNALDKHRPSLDDLEVEMIRLEHKGISPTKVTVSLVLLTLGIINFYYIPGAIIYKELQYFLHLVNNELLLLILGLTFLAQTLIPFMEVWILDFMLFLNPRDRYMRSIVVKNFESHGTKNLKSSMMFTVSLAFLVFVGALFQMMSFFVVSMSKFFAGANITAQRIDFS